MFLNAPDSSCCSGYNVNKKTVPPRRSQLQAALAKATGSGDSSDFRLSILATILGTDFTHGWCLQPDFGKAVELAKQIQRELGGVNADLGTVATSPTFKSLIKKSLSKKRALDFTCLTEHDVGKMVQNSVLMFEYAPVTQLDFGAKTGPNRIQALWDDEYTVSVGPLQPIPESSPKSHEWYRLHFGDHGEEDDEKPFFQGKVWSRMPKQKWSITLPPPPTFEQYCQAYPDVNSSSLAPDTKVARGALLPFIPQMCDHESLVEWSRCHGVIFKKNYFHRYTVHVPEYKLGYEDSVLQALGLRAALEPPTDSRSGRRMGT